MKALQAGAGPEDGRVPRDSCLPQISVVEELISRLSLGASGVGLPKCWVGFDGYLDSLYRVVRQRPGRGAPEHFRTIAEFGGRVSACAERSGDIELERQETRFGGNAPLMAQGVASLGLPTTCVGLMGYPEVDEAFEPMLEKCRLVSIGDPSRSMAFEFDDGKIMFGDLSEMQALDWRFLVERVGMKKLAEFLGESQLFAILNWSAAGDMNSILAGMIHEIFPMLEPDLLRKKILFFDLSDPSARSEEDIGELVRSLAEISRYAPVTLSLNENELHVLCNRLGCAPACATRDELAKSLFNRLEIDVLVVHLLRYSIAVSGNGLVEAEGFHVSRPVVSTGGGDNFNAGFCTARLSGLGLKESLTVGNAVSSFYVSAGRSPDLKALAGYLKSACIRNRPGDEN